MEIQSTKLVRVVPLETAHAKAVRVVVAPHLARHVPEKLRVNGMVFEVDRHDPDALDAFAEDMEHVIKRARDIARKTRKDRQPAKTTLQKASAIGGAAVAGGVVGLSAAVALQEAGKIARNSGNPYWNAFSIACTALGAGLAAGSAAGVFYGGLKDGKPYFGTGRRPA